MDSKTESAAKVPTQANPLRRARMRTRCLLPLFLVLGCSTPEVAADHDDAHVLLVEEFRSARARGDLDAARAMMSTDPRLWYDSKEGEGSPWTMGGGRWSAWDEHFRGVTEREGAWHVEGDRVWADMVETNEYYELTEAPSRRMWRGTYFIDDADKIAGFMVSAVPGVSRAPGRADEFKAWAREHHPDEAEYLMPGGKLDPTEDRAPRMRALLNEWRLSVGLQPIPATPPEGDSE